MYDYLAGTLVEKTPSHVVIDVGGVGFFLHTPGRLADELPPTGEAAKLWVHPHHVEGEFGRLYAFERPFDRRVFRLLIGISKVGPTAALALLTAFRSEEIASAIVRGDGALLTRAKGIGRKTADRLVLELREAFEKLASNAGLPNTPPTPAGRMAQDLLHVLIGLGYGRKEAETLVDDVVPKHPDADLETLIRYAIQPS